MKNGVSSALDMQILSARSSEPSNRQARRRSQTRSRLVRAAAALFARQGVDNTRINEITDEADVGFGSFYNHFKSKEEIVEAVLTETLAAQGAAVADLTAGLEDPAEVVAVAHRHFVELARTDPDWAWLLIRLDLSQKLALGALGPFAEQDIAAGVKAGRFHVANRRIAMLDAGGGLLSVMREVLDGRAPKDAGRLHAEGVLRLLGLEPEDAAEVARRPMPATSKKA
ncbi:MAG TPA: TetR/AcrR family transcriptional regulator [Candidatus Udaeobacter sp.]|nr:TetR/AcrR family transcriptional regulator [Candidatus Udaeobacter sp.]